MVCVQRRLSDDEDMVVMDMDDYGVVVGSSVRCSCYCANPEAVGNFTSSQCLAYPVPPCALSLAGCLEMDGAML